MNFWILNLVFHIIIPSILLVVGNIGNFLIILIFIRKNLRNYSSSVYFIAIAIADTFALNIECLQFYVPTIIGYSWNKSYLNEYWAKHFKKDVDVITAAHLNDVICKLQSLSFYTADE